MPSGDYIPDWFCDATGRFGWMNEKQERAIEQAKLYRAEHGDPVDNLASLLSAIADEETWKEVINDPDVYGNGGETNEHP